MIRAVGAATVALLCLVGCSSVREQLDPAVQPAQGAGTAAALIVRSEAAHVIADLARVTDRGCRANLPDTGPLRVETTITYALKEPIVATEHIFEVRTWNRDGAGNVATRTSLYFLLPDGRPAIRSIETRWVDGRAYRAVDDRFADASRIAGIRDEIDRAAYIGVDDLLSTVARSGDRIVSLGGRPPLCRGERLASLPRPEQASVTFGADGRRGWLVWVEPTSQRHVTAQFVERVSTAADPVTAPDELWPVDPDVSYDEVGTFLTRAQEEGWILPPRTPNDGSGDQDP